MKRTVINVRSRDNKRREWNPRKSEFAVDASARLHRTDTWHTRKTWREEEARMHSSENRSSIVPSILSEPISIQCDARPTAAPQHPLDF